MTDLCPIATMYADVNISGHLLAIKLAALGPANPRLPNALYWEDKMAKWNVSEGVARTRLCMNCAHYDNSPETLACIASGPGGQVNPSELPLTPKWEDIPGMPGAVCTRYPITCSALRTCDDWEDPNLDPDNANIQFVSPEEDNTDE